MNKRPLVTIAVGYITGIIWGLYLKSSIVPIFFLIGGICFILTKTNIIKKEYISKSFIIGIMTYSIFATISNIQIMDLESKYDSLYKDVEEIKVIGTVISKRDETTYKAKYTIKVETVNDNIKYNGTNLIIYVTKDKILEYGDKVYISGTYEEASSATNYKLFDYKEYLKEKNTYGIVTAETVEIIEKENLNIIIMLFNNIREKIKLNLEKVIGEEAQVTIGILLRRNRRNFRRNNRRF